MIVYAFSTLGKTYLAKNYPGKVFDFEVNKIAKMSGYDSFGEMDDASKQREVALLLLAADVYPVVTVTIADILKHPMVLKWMETRDEKVKILLPSFGISEFRRRLEMRGKPLVLQQEWKYLGGDKFVPVQRSLSNEFANLSRLFKSMNSKASFVVQKVNFVEDAVKFRRVSEKE